MQHVSDDREKIHTGWASGASAYAACRASERTGNRTLLIDDAFVRSLRPGCKEAIYGITADTGRRIDLGTHADLLQTLESGLPSGWMRNGSPDDKTTAELLGRFRNMGVSRHNWFPGEYLQPAQQSTQGILLDIEEANFGKSLHAAFELKENDPIYLLATRDDVSQIRLRPRVRDLLSDSRIRFLSRDLSPLQYFATCHTVIVNESLLGMEALIHEKQVITCGSPFFAGRGLTRDLDPSLAEKSRRHVDLLELFNAAYLQYSHYYDPDTKEPCELDAILDHIELQKDMFRKNSGHFTSVGFSPWKRKVVPYYLRSPAGSLTQVNGISDVSQNSRMLVWGRKTDIPVQVQNRTVHVEDGFIRSKGLGAAFNFPYSWVMDETGIYFDSSGPSDLERLLNEGFEDADLAEAEQLIDSLRAKRMTKYNLAATPIAFDRQQATPRKIILVPGQVEADASIKYGSPAVKSNIELLEAVRKEEPEAFLIFKAHPDLVASARHGKILSEGTERLADLVVTDGNVLDWLDQCDEVHTMTSTVGFEALIRKFPVVTYGLPFYAGWGLTKDHLTCDRRKRKLKLEELVCGALMKYPRYLNPRTGEFTTALKVIKLLSSEETCSTHRTWYLKAIFCIKRARVKVGRM